MHEWRQPGIGIGFNEAARQTRDRTNCSLFHLYPSPLSLTCANTTPKTTAATPITTTATRERTLRAAPLSHDSGRHGGSQIKSPSKRCRVACKAPPHTSLSRPPWAYSLLRGVWLLLPQVGGKFCGLGCQSEYLSVASLLVKGLSPLVKELAKKGTYQMFCLLFPPHTSTRSSCSQ